MKLLTGFAIVKDNVGNRIAYTTSEVDETGTIIKRVLLYLIQKQII